MTSSEAFSFLDSYFHDIFSSLFLSEHVFFLTMSLECHILHHHLVVPRLLLCLFLELLSVFEDPQTKLTRGEGVHQAVSPENGVGRETCNIRDVAAPTVKADLRPRQRTTCSLFDDLDHVHRAPMNDTQSVQFSTQVVADDDRILINEAEESCTGGRPSFEDLVSGLTSVFDVSKAGKACDRGVPV
jgi:hypothetical protein